MALIGISFPFRKEKGEFPKKDIDREAVRSNMVALFKMQRRSRIMRPELGSNMVNFVFESITPLLLSKIERSIRETIAFGEPRASIVSINFTEQNTKIIADIVYEVNGIEESLSVVAGQKIN